MSIIHLAVTKTLYPPRPRFFNFCGSADGAGIPGLETGIGGNRTLNIGFEKS